ncbi:unnamed protein product, partial [Closterium sp. NIES-65]
MHSTDAHALHRCPCTPPLPMHSTAAHALHCCPYTPPLPMHSTAAHALHCCPCTPLLPMHSTAALLATVPVPLLAAATCSTTSRGLPLRRHRHQVPAASPPEPSLLFLLLSLPCTFFSPFFPFPLTLSSTAALALLLAPPLLPINSTKAIFQADWLLLLL